MLPDGWGASRIEGGLRIVLPTGIFPPDIGGPASYVPRIAAALTERGHSVCVITLADDPDAGGKYPFPVVRIRRGMGRIPRMIRAVSAMTVLARAADLIFANGLFIESAFAAFLAGRPLAMKIVGDWAWERAHNRGAGGWNVGDFQIRRQSPRWEAVKRLRSTVTERADRIIAPSRFVADIIAAWGVPEGRITVVYNALEESPDPPPADLPFFDGRTLIAVGRLIPLKGIDGLVELVGEDEKLRLLVVGDGPDRSRLESLAVKLGAAERVVFTGAVERERIPAYLKAADAYVLNSLHEGLPHILLEAFSAGLPVVATATGGTTELVEDGVNGLLIPPHRKDRLASAVGRIIADSDLRNSLVEGGRRTLQTRFRWEDMVNETERVLAETAARVGKGR
ncbi:MAG: glycosyltransferase family 4 protein [Anaerolineales bacterium]